MKYLHRPPLVALVFLLFLALACKNQAGPSEKGDVDLSEKGKTQIPLRIANPEAEDLLRQAALDGNMTQVEELLEQGVNVNAANTEGQTALILAAYNGHSKIILSLLEEGAELSHRDAMGRTALMYGSTGSFPEAVKVLLDKGAEPNAVDSDEHFTALMHAAAEGHLEVVKVLLSYGADPKLKDIDGDDAASFAKQSGHSHVVEFLQKEK